MYVLIEGHKYRGDLINHVVPDIYPLANPADGVTIEHVGYYYNNSTNIDDCVLLLPKVLLDKDDKILGKYRPEDVYNLNDDKNPIVKNEKRFIYEFSVCIYRAIAVYKAKNSESKIVLQNNIIPVGKGRRHPLNTFLEIILALIKFNRENQNFFIFTLRNLHSGYNKINWTRTISTSDAIIQNETPIYLDVVNKKKRINFEEELLVIYFSILNYINEHFGFQTDINFNFPLIKGKQFDAYITKEIGKRRLQQIKYKYFSDKALELWDLCYDFFEGSKQIRMSGEQKEYLLAKNFNIVFEDIIDELIGDREVPKGLKEQEDGKLVDHLYLYQDLYEAVDRKTYYIGDSKYYKSNNPIGKESVYKQFTYARNVIQWNMDLFLDSDESDNNRIADKKKYKDFKLRDDVTEGYTVIPNFFISARMDFKKLDYKDKEIKISDKQKHEFRNRHWDNRLFDRDTLLICHYDVDFLYVLSLYSRNNILEKEAWKRDARKQFRDEIRNALKEKYDFYVLKADKNPEEYINKHFKKLIGKIYSPSSANDNSEKLFYIALEKGSKDNPEIEDLIHKDTDFPFTIMSESHPNPMAAPKN